MSTKKRDYHRTGVCINCGSEKLIMAKGRCGACYQANRRGKERSPLREEIQELRRQALLEEQSEVASS